jgi:type III secretion protein J
MSVIRTLLCLLILAVLPGCRDQILYSGLAQREANEMMALLKRSGVDVKLALEARGGTYVLNVSEAQAVAAVDVLTRAGLPRQKTPAMSELLPKDAWMLSPGEERTKLAYALSQDMTATLRQLAGVSDVRVHVAPADRNALGQIAAPASASVFLRYDADLMGPDFADKIRSLVANGISGLAYDKVSVLMVPQQEPAIGAVRAALPSIVPSASASTPAASQVGGGPQAAASPWSSFGGLDPRWLAAGGLAALFAGIVLRLLRARA